MTKPKDQSPEAKAIADSIAACKDFNEALEATARALYENMLDVKSTYVNVSLTPTEIHFRVSTKPESEDTEKTVGKRIKKDK